MRVGLCWQGSTSHRNDSNRSIPVAELAGLQVVTGVTWMALCPDGWRQEMADNAGLVNGLDGCVDWFDTAAVVRRLDLVITVDTALAHLAGGCGVPVWIMLAAVPDFRWGLASTTTPWYTSARLYRQRVAGTWSDVIARVAADLQQECLARRSA